jgi:hypothetical protein
MISKKTLISAIASMFVLVSMNSIAASGQGTGGQAGGGGGVSGGGTSVGLGSNLGGGAGNVHGKKI